MKRVGGGACGRGRTNRSRVEGGPIQGAGAKRCRTAELAWRRRLYLQLEAFLLKNDEPRPGLQWTPVKKSIMTLPPRPPRFWLLRSTYFFNCRGSVGKLKTARRRRKKSGFSVTLMTTKGQNATQTQRAVSVERPTTGLSHGRQVASHGRGRCVTRKTCPSKRGGARPCYTVVTRPFRRGAAEHQRGWGRRRRRLSPRNCGAKYSVRDRMSGCT